MSFLESTDKQKTALQIKSWLDSLHAGVESAKTNYDSLINWLSTCTDEEYSKEDKEEVIAKITEAMEKATSLIPR